MAQLDQSGQTWSSIAPPVPLTLAQLTAGMFIGADGVPDASANNVQPYNFQSYRGVQAFLTFGTVGGGLTPGASLSLLGYPNQSDMTVVASCTTPLNLTGPLTLYCGRNYPIAAAGILGGIATVLSPILAPYGRFQLGSSVGLTLFSGTPMLYIYGVK